MNKGQLSQLIDSKRQLRICTEMSISNFWKLQLKNLKNQQPTISTKWIVRLGKSRVCSLFNN